MRRASLLLTGAALCLSLSGCGGGGGSGGVSPAPVPPTGTPAPTPTPTPAATSFVSPPTTTTYTSDGAAADLSFNLTSRTTINGRTASGGALSISYDAPTNSYTVSAAGRSQTFAAADIEASDDIDTAYRKVNGSTRENLTLVKIPYSSTQATQYVRLGFWQRNDLTETQQNTLFSAFTYGFPTPAAGVPRTGTGNFRADAFGLVAYPGFAPRSFQGGGSFDADFAGGVFQMNVRVSETDLTTDAETTGALDVRAGGTLSASDGTFTGNMVYTGSRGRLAGNLGGRFYGPVGQEFGASFSGVNADGATVTGAVTGQRNEGAATTAPLTLAGITGTQSIFAKGAILSVTTSAATPGFSATTDPVTGRIEYRPGSTIFFSPGQSSLPTAEWPSSAIVSPPTSNFNSYRQTLDGKAVSFHLYKVGSANSELALTYSSLGGYSTQLQTGNVVDIQQFFAYGLDTPASLLGARTGTGVYTGVVYGAGANQREGSRYDITGTSRFDVDFSNQRLTGSLGLQGAQTNGARTDFGTFAFSANLSRTVLDTQATVTRAGQDAGSIETRFFGPDGQEIGGVFRLMTPSGVPGGGTTIAGATVAKRQ